MKHKHLLVTVVVIAVGVCSTVLVLKAHRSDSGRPPSNDFQTPPAFATTLTGPLNLAGLTNQAAVIVVGRVLDLSPGPDQESKTGKSYLATVHVNRVLKGSVDMSTITIRLIKASNGVTVAKRITPSLYAMFFLNQESPNIYALADQYVQAVVATEGPANSSGDVLDRVVNEVAHVLVSSDNSFQDQLQAVAALTLVDSPAANQALHRALASKDENVRLEAEAGLLTHNDVSVLEQVEGTLMKLPADISDNSVLRLSSGIERGIRDPNAIPILARLLSAHNPRVRQAVAHALRETRAIAAIGPLSAALNDSDQMVRYDAVLGLAEITRDFSHAPSVDMFKRDEKKYLTYWRERIR